MVIGMQNKMVIGKQNGHWNTKRSLENKMVIGATNGHWDNSKWSESFVLHFNDHFLGIGLYDFLLNCFCPGRTTLYANNTSHEKHSLTWFSMWMSRTKVTIEGYKNYCQKNAGWWNNPKKFGSCNETFTTEKKNIVVQKRVKKWLVQISRCIWGGYG